MSYSSYYSPPPPDSLSTAIKVTIIVGVLFVVWFLALSCYLIRRKRIIQALTYGTNTVLKPQPAAVHQQQEFSSSTGGSTTNSGKPLTVHQPQESSGSSGASAWKPGKRAQSRLPSPGTPIIVFRQTSFTYEELSLATNGFSDANLLGQGGFGFVHRGMLPNGKEVAVKQLRAEGPQGDREFQVEVETISRVHHKHLVSLVGYCITGDKRILVFEFVPNNTLEFHLHGKERPAMNWSTRLKIAVGSAKGLAYLHEDCHPKIIHRDAKTANILLDYEFNAKVADFGLAKFFADDEDITHVSTRIMGTLGYLAPEYATSGKLTYKSDVYSFGVMLLELISGRRPIDRTLPPGQNILVEWARPLLAQAVENGNCYPLVDPRLLKYDTDEMERMVGTAAASIRHSAKRRPVMSQIVRILEGHVSLEEINKEFKSGRKTLYEISDSDSEQHNIDIRTS